MKLLKPPPLSKGDTIALISTSSPIAHAVPHRKIRAIEALKKIGFNVVLGPNALKHTGYTAGTGEERAADFNWAISHPKVKGIISFIGGDHSIHMLPHIRYDLVKQSPKVVCGYSDTTVLGLALYAKTGLVTFSGPAALTQFAEFPELDPYTEEYFLRATTSSTPIGEVVPSKSWTEDVLNWFTKTDLSRPRKRKKNRGYEWLREGKGQGPLIGGCISSLMHLIGTPYFPNFKNAVFFLEIPEGSNIKVGEDVSKIDTYLHHLKLARIFESLNGLIIGRPFGYSVQDSKFLKKILLDVTKEYKFPILYSADIGYTDPMITVPVGAQAVLDSHTATCVRPLPPRYNFPTMRKQL